jgi:hypothetical protein
MENKPNTHKDKLSIRERIANIIVIVQPAATKTEPEPKKPAKSGFDLVALILKIAGTLIALFKLFK